MNEKVLQSFDKDNFKKDFLASLVVFLVALPLCVGIAMASGLPAEAGILSGIIGGIVVGIFSGAPLQVSGPAAGLIVIVYDLIQKLGLESLGVIVLAAGLIQIAFGVLGWGKWFRAISPAVIQGMLSGIGITILLSQFHVMLDAPIGKNVFENISNIIPIIKEAVVPFDGSTHHLAAGVGILTIVIAAYWKHMPQKYKALPPTLVAVAFAMIAAYIFHLPIKYVSISTNIAESINFISLEQIKNLFTYDYMVEAIGLAFIASAETLLTCTAIDKMSNLHKTNYNKEILAQGIGNTLAGFIGALPITGVIVRSAANVNAGARTRYSTILHGIWILLFVTTLSFVFKFIPSSALAAVLVYTGYKLVNIDMAKTIYKASRGEFLIYLITIIAILSTNLLEGILIGLGIGILKNLYRLCKFRIKTIETQEENKVLIKIKGNLTFLRLPQIAEVIENIENGKNVEIIFDNVHIADHATIDLLAGWSNRYIENKGTVKIDWEQLKKIYPEFGWDSLNQTYPEINTNSQ